MNATVKPMAMRDETGGVDRTQAEAAIRTLLQYIGEDPDRPGLKETPARVIRAMDEFYAGYREDPDRQLGKIFEDIQGYQDLVLMRNIRFVSHCEHHMLPIIGVAHVGYWPGAKVVGISKLARLVEVVATRLQSQEAMTEQIADAIERVLAPRGIAVRIAAEHQCMTTRGVGQPGMDCVTQAWRGLPLSDPAARAAFDLAVKA